MKQRLRNIGNSLKWQSFQFPVTVYFLIFIIAVLLGYIWLGSKAEVPDSAYSAVFKLLLRFSGFFLISILILAFLSTFIPFLFFIIKKKRTGIDFRLSADAILKSPGNNAQKMNIHISPIIKPFLGFIRVRLRYGKSDFSDKFSLIKRSDKKIFSSTLDAVYWWSLPEIKEYRIENAVIYFEDFFQFFSFTVPLKANNDFHTYPFIQPVPTLTVSPRQTEETNIRIEEIKKVEGEHINYKNFESNDDVRRIVWKIYAKNKELVVRIPEILDSYASHMVMYASFHSIYDTHGNEVIQIPFLNYYKTICWSVYEQFRKKGFEIRYIPDQDISYSQHGSEQDQVKYAISVSKWHTEKGLRSYIHPKDASIVIISSLSDPDELEQLIQNSGSEITFIFVPVSEGLKKQKFSDWLEWIFIQKEKDITSVYRTSWSVSLLRLKIIKNEKRIKEILNKHDRSSVISKKEISK